MNKSAETQVKVIKADKRLQAKVGTGFLNKNTVTRGDNIIENNTVDFAPMALEYLDKLEEAIQNISDNPDSMKESLHTLTTPVMQLKANASTFKYNLIGNLANIMLSFLESLEKPDKDAVAIVQAHHQTLKAIVLKKMAGDGGPLGKQMEDELKAVCKRYFAKRT